MHCVIVHVRSRYSRTRYKGGKGSSCPLHLNYCMQVKHMLGTTSESANTIEENTHIAYLCDLLERIWGHGLKKREVGIN